MYLIKRNGSIVKHVVMVGEVKYKMYKNPNVIDLSFDTFKSAQDVANILGNCEVVEAA